MVQLNTYVLPRENDLHLLPAGVCGKLLLDKVLEVFVEAIHELSTWCDAIRVKPRRRRENFFSLKHKITTMCAVSLQTLHYTTDDQSESPHSHPVILLSYLAHAISYTYPILPQLLSGHQGCPGTLGTTPGLSLMRVICLHIIDPRSGIGLGLWAYQDYGQEILEIGGKSRVSPRVSGDVLGKVGARLESPLIM